MLRDYSTTCFNDTSKVKLAALQVYAVADGKVAYSQRNNNECPVRDGVRSKCDRFPLGLGMTVIIDHGNGIYSLYAHMAQDRESLICLPRNVIDSGETSKVKVGDSVKAGDVIGYLGAIGPGMNPEETPSGNALQTNESIQLHFELFSAKPGLFSRGAIWEITPQANRGQIDPTEFLSQFYK